MGQVGRINLQVPKGTSLFVCTKLTPFQGKYQLLKNRKIK